MPNRAGSERERTVFSASSVLDTVGDALSVIRREDGLTFDDMGAVMHKSADQAAKYCAGSAQMDLITYARCRREWNGRFDGALDRLCHDSRPNKRGSRNIQPAVLKAALAMAQALEDDGEISPKEVRENRATLEDARDAIDGLLRSLSVREVAA